MAKDNNETQLLRERCKSNEPNEKQNEMEELEEREKLVAKKDPTTPMQDIHETFEECKFGRFHMRLLITSFIAQIASLLVSLSTSYLLPIAECDLDMNLKQKGLLTAMPFVGTIISNVLSGFMIDTFGRIIFLRIGYSGLFICNLLSACSQNYEMFAVAKLGEGLLSGIANSAIMPITAEFCHPDVRDRVMLSQAAVSAVAQIICPAMAWVFLVHEWELSLFDGVFVLKTWNLYLFAMSTWSLMGYILYTTVPESPKFLVTQNKYFQAKQILIIVYTENTGRSAESFPYLDLWEQQIQEESSKKVAVKSTSQKFQEQILVGLNNMKPMLHRPLLSYLLILSSMQLIIVGMYDVLRLWFPQLSTIVEHYSLDGEQNLCVLLDNYTAMEKNKMPDTTLNSSTECVPVMSRPFMHDVQYCQIRALLRFVQKFKHCRREHISGTDTYVHSMIIGLVWTIPYFITGVAVNRVGKKRLLMLSGVICICALFGIRWASSKSMMVAFFSVDIAIMQTMKSLGQVVQVEVFPTSMRSLAMALVSVTSRVGTLIGNISFPILLEMGCAIPFYIMIGMMMGLIMLAIFTPRKKEV